MLDEILRALDALQVSDEYKVAMPLDWRRGDKVICPVPKSLDALNERLADDSIEKITWYLAKKNI
jgi:peroxiredoxin (alkyl hydroperoxide reductase subunit C)